MNEKQKVECSNKLSLATVIILYWKCEQSMKFSEKIQKKPKKIASPLAGLVKYRGEFSLLGEKLQKKGRKEGQWAKKTEKAERN
ncbi:hypothetical protein ACXO1P_05530 [Lactobacillus delbrueckii subsp. bulgaricus]